MLIVHQGPGLTNALTGITEAAKSRTPLLILAPAATSPRSNFYLDHAALATAVGAVPVRLSAAATAAADLARACRIAVAERRTVLLSMPLDVQAAAASPFTLPAVPPAHAPRTGQRGGRRAGRRPDRAPAGRSFSPAAALEMREKN